MKNHTENDSRSPSPAGARNDTAQAALGSGFGAVIEKERDLRSATEESFGRTIGARSADLDRILHHQHSRLGANIALLEQRCEALPNPERFANWHGGVPPSAHARRARPDEVELLPSLVAQHVRLLAEIDALIDGAPGGLRGELILAEVSRSHEEMAWMLTALLKEDDSTERIARDRDPHGSGGTDPALESWDNEGGPVRVEPPSSQESLSRSNPK